MRAALFIQFGRRGRPQVGPTSAGADHDVSAGDLHLSHDVVRHDVERVAFPRELLADGLEARHRLHVAALHGAARVKQQQLRRWLRADVEVTVFRGEAEVSRHRFAARRVLEARVEAQSRAAVGDALGDGCARAGLLILAEHERPRPERAADVAQLQRAVTEVAVGEVGLRRGVAGAIPEVAFVAAPHIAGQQAALVAVDLIEPAEVIPLRDHQVRLELAPVRDEHIVERGLE